MKPENYSLRKAIVKDIIDSKMTIDWRSPAQIIADAFDVVDSKDNLTPDLRKLVFVALRCDSLEKAQNESMIRKLSTTMDDLRRYDQRLSKDEVESRNRMGRSYRSQVPQEARKVEYAQFNPSEVSEETTSAKMARIDQAESALLSVTARDMSELMQKDQTDEIARQLLARYNGSIKYHLRASALSHSLTIVRGETPGSNDFFDLNHFLYLDKDTIMVSDDGLVVRLCNELWPRQRAGIDEYWELQGSKGEPNKSLELSP